jgi:hypothetical protein
VSIDTVNKTVTYANASGVAEAVRSNTQVVFCPDRIIDFTSSGNLGFDAQRGGGTTVTGFTLLSTSTITFVFGIRVASATLSVSHCTAFGLRDGGFGAIRGGVLATDANCAAIKIATGFQATETGAVICDGTYSADSATGYAQVLGGGYLRANNAVATNCALGFFSQLGGTISAISATASHNTDCGFKAQENSAIYALGATARNNGTGYLATLFGMITASSTNANNSGNGTNYNPPTSGIEGNASGLILWS